MRDRTEAAIEQLARLGGRDLARQLVTLYAEQMRERLVAARDAVRRPDPTALAALAHAMRSSSAQLGATELVEACESMEDAAERGDDREATIALSTIETCFAALESRLEEGLTAAGAAVAFNQGDKSPAGDRLRIAVIEDNADNRLLIDAILGDRFTLDEYGSGAEALEGMRERVPDLVLLDVSLPGMDGLDVLKRMREVGALRPVPVVAVTAHAMAGDRSRYLAAGFDGYVPKPIDDEAVLVDVVGRLLTRQRAADGT